MPPSASRRWPPRQRRWPPLTSPSARYAACCMLRPTHCAPHTHKHTHAHAVRRPSTFLSPRLSPRHSLTSACQPHAPQTSGGRHGDAEQRRDTRAGAGNAGHRLPLSGCSLCPRPPGAGFRRRGEVGSGVAGARTCCTRAACRPRCWRGLPIPLTTSTATLLQFVTPLQRKLKSDAKALQKMEEAFKSEAR